MDNVNTILLIDPMLFRMLFKVKTLSINGN